MNLPFLYIEQACVVMTNYLASILCILTSIYLTISEFIRFETVTTNTNIRVNTPKHYHFNETIPVILNISIPYVACPIFTIDIEDVLGRHELTHDPTKTQFYRLIWDNQTTRNTKKNMIDDIDAQHSFRFKNEPSIVKRYVKSEVSQSLVICCCFVYPCTKQF